MRKIRYKEASPSLSRIAEPNFEQQNRASVGMEKFVGEFYYLNVEKLIPYSKQARVVFDETELKNLADTIKAHGVRQPLTVIRSPEKDGFFEVISGERRLRAAKLAGLEKVPCIILDNISQAEEIALIENIQRQDLHPIELARSIKVLIDKRGWGAQTELHKQIGLSLSQISELLKLTELSPDLQSLMLDKNFRGREKLRKLFALESDEERKKYILDASEVAVSGNREPKRNLTSMSVLRLSITEDGLRIQKAGLRKLSPLQREQIKEKLIQILDELEG